MPKAKVCKPGGGCSYFVVILFHKSFDHIPLANVILLARALNEIIPTNSNLMDSFFVVLLKKFKLL